LFYISTLPKIKRKAPVGILFAPGSVVCGFGLLVFWLLLRYFLKQWRRTLGTKYNNIII